MASNTALTTNSELLDDLVLAAARGDSLALGALEARYGGVVNRVVRARVFAERRYFITEDCAWASARLAIRRIGSLQASGTPFLAWLELSAEEAFAAPVDAFDQSARDNDGIADVDRCALDLHVLGYGSFEIASVLAEPQTTVRQRIEATKQRLWARALAGQAD
jgi:hypothetical protein